MDADPRDEEIARLRAERDKLAQTNAELAVLVARYSNPPAHAGSTPPGEGAPREERPTTFELTLQSTTAADTHRLVAEWNRPTQLPVRCERAVKLDAAQLAATAAAKYGELLGRALFDGTIRELFAQARADTSPPRVLLAVEAPALQTLRWERLCGPFDDDRWEPLELNQRAPFSLYLPSTTDRLFRAFGRAELKALVLVAAPKPGGVVEPFDEDAAVDAVLQGLGGIPSVVLGKCARAKAPATLTSLAQRLQEERFTLLHLVCHGAYSKSTGETALFLDDDQGNAVPVPASELVALLRRLGNDHGLPHFVFLATCDSARPEAEGAHGGLAQRLVREVGMPAVLAMTERVSQETALALGREFYPRLKAHGEVDRALAEALVALRKRRDVGVPVPALFSRLGGRALFEDSGAAPLAPDEIRDAAERLDGYFQVRAPSLVAAVTEHVKALLAVADAAAADALVTRQRHLDALEHLCHESLECSFTALARGTTPPEYTDACPFPGLRPFTEDERRFFRGRKALVDAALGRGEVQPMVALVGPSGSGKSSLLAAGVVPAMRARVEGLRAKLMTPGARPMATLTAALAELDGADDSLLAIDQFEEVFTQCDDADERARFVDAVVRRTTPRHRVVFALRVDFLGECVALPELQGVLQRAQQRVAPLTPDELRKAIEEQAAEAGLRFESGLCEAILDDVSGEPGAMPLLQHALRRVWQQRHGRWLLLSEYRAVGGVQSAITQTAEEVFEALRATTPDAGRRVRDIFLRLTRLDEDASVGGTRRDTRRRETHEALLTVGEAEHTRRLIDALVDASLLRVSERDGVSEVEVAHEALIRRWSRLAGWIDEDRAVLRLRAALGDAAAQWETHPGASSEAYLVHQGPMLAEAETLRAQGRLALNVREGRYLDACVARRDRVAREREARNVAFVVNDLLRRDLTKALRFGELASRLDEAGALPQSGQCLRDVWERAVAQRQAWYTLRLALESPARAVAFSPDGARLLTVTREAARVYDLHGALVASVAHDRNLAFAAFSPDGARIATVGDGYQVRLWSAAGAEIARLEGHAPPTQDGTSAYDDIDHAAWSPDGTRLVTVGADHNVMLWDERGGKVRAIHDHRSVVRTAAWSPDSARFVTCGHWWDCTARLYDRDGARIAELGDDEGEAVQEKHWERGILSAAWSPDGALVVTTSADHTVRLWRADGAGVAVLRTHTDRVTCARFLPDGTRFVTAGSDGLVVLWSRDGVALCELRHDGAPSPWSSVAVSPDGALFACGGEHGVIVAWNTDGTLVAHYNAHTSRVRALDFSPDGALLASAGEDRTVMLWRVRPSVQTTFAHGDAVTVARFVPEGVLGGGVGVITTSNDMTLRAWSLDGTLLWTATDFGPDAYGNQRVYALVLGDDGRVAVTASTDYQVRVWDVATGEQRGIWTTDDDESFSDSGWGGVMSLALTPGGDLVAGGDFGGGVRVWSCEGELKLKLPRHPDQVYGVDLGEGGAVVVTGCGDGVVRVWDGATGALRAELRGHRGPVRSVRLTRDGGEVLSVSDDCTARLWSLDGACLRVFDRHPNKLRMGGFSPDERVIITASEDDTVRLWSREGRSVGAVRGGGAWLHGAEMSPDGEYVLTASPDCTARLWPSARRVREQIERDWRDVARLTADDLEEYGLDAAICAPLLR